MADPIVGIDLGTSNTVVAYAEEAGSVRVLADESGTKIHPSVVSFHPNGGVVVGAAAKQRKVIDPKNTIFSVKRLIGRTFGSPEVQTAKGRMPFEIKEGANQQPIVTTRGGDFAVPEVSAIILDHVRNVAAGQLQTDVNRAVVTVPASFNDAQRSATATSGAIAGLTIVRVLNEPTAAALAYGHTRNLRETIAVYDFGGGTFDITILRLEDQVYEVLGTSGDTFLGGDDLDERLVDRMVEKFLAENRIDLRSNEVSMMRLRAVAEQTKIELSRRSRAVVRVDEIAYGPKGKPLDLQIEISRDEFVRQVADIIDRTFPVCQESLAYAGLSVDRIDDVILVGGTTKIPYVRDQVARFFARAPRTDVSPEDAVAMGAALQATSLERILKRKSPSRVSGAVQIQPADTQHDTLMTTTISDELTESSATMPQAEYPIPQVGVDDDFLELAPPGAPATAKRTTASYGALGRRPAPPASDPDRAPARGQHHDRLAEATPPPGAPPLAAPIGRMTKPNVTRPEPSRPPPMTGGQRTTQPPPMAASQRTTQPPPMTGSPRTTQPTGSQRTTQPPPMTGGQRTTQPTGSQRTVQPTGSQRTTQPRASQPPPLATSQPPPSPATTRPGMTPASAQTLYGVPPGSPAPSTHPGQPPPTPPPRRAQPTPPAPHPRVKQPTTQSRVAEKPPSSRNSEPPPGLAPLGPTSTTRPVLDPLAGFANEGDPLAGLAPETDPLAGFANEHAPRAGFAPDHGFENEHHDPLADVELDPRAFQPEPDPLAGFAPEDFSLDPGVPAAAPQARTLIAEPPRPRPAPVAPPQAPTMMLEPSPSTTAKGFGAIGPADTAPALPPSSTAKGFAPPVQSFAMHNPVVLDVTPRGLGIGTVAGYCEELIRRNSRVPMEIRKLFTTSRDAQDTVRIIVCQGESRRLGENVVIGDLTLAGLPKRARGETSIEVTFMLDASGILQVRARDAQTGHEQRATLDLAGAMPQADVAASRERMQALRR